MTLRRRVLAYMAVAAIGSCALTVGVAVALVRHQISGQRMAALERQADALAAAPALPPGDHVYGVGSGRFRLLGQARAAAILGAIGATGDGQGAVTARSRPVLYVSRTTSTGRVVVVRGAGLAFAEWRPFLWSLVLAGLGGALVAVALSFLLARRLAQPLGELSAATARLASGEHGVAVPVHGEDELGELAAAFNEMSGELARARDAQRQFLESVSHELKTPLTSIRGYAEAVSEGAVAPAEAGRVIAAEADRLERLVQDLLELARLGRAGFEVKRGPVDLAAVVDQAVERHRPQAAEHAVGLSSRSAGPALGRGDEGRLIQATSNLIENALRLTPAGGKVTAVAAPRLIVVRDTGPGLGEGDLARAFERFYLYERHRSERAVGSGLGLAIVEELVGAMGGSVEATSPPEGGAEFVIRLAAVEFPGPRAELAAESPEVAS